ncbi:MAG: hypothetical protein ACRD96_02350, partial [Bryobacteraceae bacterium]
AFRDLPSESIVRPLLALGAAGLSLYSLVTQNQKLAVDSADLHGRWNKLAHDCERLWENLYRNDADEELRRLTERGAEISKAGALFPYEEKRMLKWEEHVVSHRVQPQHG